MPADVLLLGEQHDAAEHHVLERDTVRALAGSGQLAGLAMEMAEQGRTTDGLAANATEAAVRSALSWNDEGWPWADYGPAVMEAVRHGVPVFGANLAREHMRAAMAEARFDAHLPPGAFAQQRDNIRDGHCGVLPETQITPMTRVQIARDAAMADTLVRAARPGKTVLLVAGGGHVLRRLGVPTHLPSRLRVKVVLAVAGAPVAAMPDGIDALWQTAALPAVDHCAALRTR